MTDKNKIFEELNQLENALTTTLEQVSAIKKELESSLTENVTLRMEIEKLRDRLSELEHKEPTKSQPNSNLITIYDDGFHICTNFYGQRRELDEPCAFCTELLYR
ncbi:DNA replication initiation control protein YabA [Lactococcus nasutitermitis]|uniref:DNA replication initiation control protein YabA n=1 Tax=Lactococcus nasutitermitis TaxID=1652957 RepID=A0ABV9JEY8_9LACT|nr:DNA replication initiation control protein YabA [Lactococcus nasutitermitis]